MPDEMIQDVQADSSTATQTADPSQATTQPAQQNGGPQTVPYERFQQVNARMREFERTAQTLAQELQQLRAERQAAGQPQPSPEEMQAAEALRRLIGQHPDLKGLLDAPKYGQKLDQLEKMVARLVGAQRHGLVATGRQTIGEAATRLGVDAGKLERLVLGYLADDPALYQRFADTGDASVVREVLKDIEETIFGKLKREAAASLGHTKLNTTQLPKPGASTMPGEPAPKPLEPGKEREYRREMHSDARRMLRELMQG